MTGTDEALADELEAVTTGSCYNGVMRHDISHDLYNRILTALRTPELSNSEWIAASIWAGVFPAKATADQVAGWRAALSPPASEAVGEAVERLTKQLGLALVALEVIADGDGPPQDIAQQTLDDITRVGMEANGLTRIDQALADTGREG